MRLKVTNIEVLRRTAGEMGIGLSEENFKTFLKYKKMILEWNQRINLTTITDNDEMDIKHFADSLSPTLTGVFDGSKKIIDIGTGAGFPGIPLKIWNPELQVALMDSLNKRISFLNLVIEELSLNGIVAIHGRAEELALRPEYRETFDICISRAVASLDTLSEYCLPFVKPGGWFIAMKGPSAMDEIKLAGKAISTLGGTVEDVIEVKFPGTDIEHTLVMIKKLTKTSSKYPRGGGKPRKSPIK